MSLILILLAAGDSKRLKSSIPKPYQIVNNKSLIEHSLIPCKNIEEIKKTIVVFNSKHKKYLNKLSLKNTVKVSGGKTRQESTLKALHRAKKMNCTKVLIHDSARANVSIKIIKNIIFNLKKNIAVIPVIDATDAIKRSKKKNNL